MNDHAHLSGALRQILHIHARLIGSGQRRLHTTGIRKTVPVRISRDHAGTGSPGRRRRVRRSPNITAEGHDDRQHTSQQEAQPARWADTEHRN
jgi:hypothetical protein